ncbi:MAG: hypothetical protein ABI700_00450 [Chloroflexota bacterium]
MQNQALTHVLIAGSRSASPQMLNYAQRVVRRVHQRGWIIIVGDNPQGVDRAVVRECRRLNVKVIVAGTANFPRNGGCKHGDYVKVERDLYRSASGNLLSGYTVRDRWMVDNAQQCMFIWNGESLGTKDGYDYAIARGKEAHLVTFERKVVPRG